MISMNCPHCHEALSIPEQYAGQSGSCKKCGSPIQVPAIDSAAGSGEIGLPADLASMLDESFARERPKPVVTAPSIGDRLQPLVKPLGIGLVVVVVAAAVVGGLAYLPNLEFAESPTPEEIATRFIEASNSGNLQEAKTYLTTKSQELFDQAGDVPNDFPKPDSYTVGTATVSGTNAEVPVEASQFGITVTNNVLLRQESGQWRVYGMRVEPMPGMSMTMNFENPEAMMEEAARMMENMSPEMMQQMMERAMQQGGDF